MAIWVSGAESTNTCFTFLNSYRENHHRGPRESFIYLFSQTVINKRRPGLIEEHKAIVSALYDRDINLAVTLLENHLKNDLEFSLYYLEFKNNK